MSDLPWLTATGASRRWVVPRLMVLGLAVITMAIAACGRPAPDEAARPGGSGSAAPSVSASPLSPEPIEPTFCERTLPTPDVCDATVDIPSWGEPANPGCPRGTVRFIGGQYAGRTHNPFEGIKKVVPADVDHDGVAEEIVLANCQVGDPAIDQVFVVDHTESGAFVTMGQVIGPVEGVSVRVYDIAASPDGSVRAQITSMLGTDDVGFAAATIQWRTYGWNGHRFMQTAGSTSFEADRSATHLAISVAPVVFAKPQGTLRHATITVKVHNTGQTTASAVAIRLFVYGWFNLAGSCQPIGDSNVVESCPSDIAAGGTRTIVLGATISVDDTAALIAAGVPGDDAMVIQLRLGDQLYSTTQIVATFQQ